MPVAAVPYYLQERDPEFYLSAPPGHRFLMYFAAWGENQETGKIDWRMKDRAPKIDKKTKQQKVGKSGPEWEDLPNDQFACSIAACKAPVHDDEKPRARKPKADPGLKPWLPMMEALLARQTIAATQIDSKEFLRLDALATAPFTTGLGNEHPLENGFAFLNPYGLPYLPGSGVKGVLRLAAQELASGDWGETHGWSQAPLPSPASGRGAGGEGISMLDALFGRKSANGDTDHLRGVLSFWDVIPQIAGDSLAVEIMTPHQSHYYQHGETPHESGQPTPISFLTVPPGSGFSFHVTCDLVRLNRLAPDLAREERWKRLLTAAFEHAFQWLGFGAKTAVGYGAMASEAMRRAKADEMAAQRDTERKAAEQRKREQAQANAETWEGARIKYNRANQSLTVEKNNKTAIALAPLGASLLASLPPDTRRKIETNQFVKVTARVSGNDLLEVGP